MLELQWIALSLGVLLVVSRIFSLLWPKEFLTFWKKQFDNKRMLKGASLFATVAGAFFLVILWSKVSPVYFLLISLSTAVLIKGLMGYFFPELVDGVFKSLHKRQGMLQLASLVVLIIGAYLLYWGYTGIFG